MNEKEDQLSMKKMKTEGFDTMDQIQAVYNVNKGIIEELENSEVKILLKVRASNSMWRDVHFEAPIDDFEFKFTKSKIENIVTGDPVFMKPFQFSECKTPRLIPNFGSLKHENENQLLMAIEYNKIDETREKNCRIALENLQSVTVGLGHFHSLSLTKKEEIEKDIREQMQEIEKLLEIIHRKYATSIHIDYN